MKKLLIILFLSIIYSTSFSQGGWLRPNNSYGTLMNRLGIDSALLFPTGCGAPSTLKAYDLGHWAIYGDSCNNAVYMYNPSTKVWQTLASALGYKANNDSVNSITGYATLYRLSLKQNIIPNLGDTIKYKKNGDSVALSGYGTQYDLNLIDSARARDSLVGNPVWVRKGIIIPTNYYASVQNPVVLKDSTPVIITGAANVFKMWYGDSLTTKRISYAESLDGITWKKYNANPILTQYGGQSVNKVGSTYYMFAVDSAIIPYYWNLTGITRRVDRLTSSDGINWTVTDTSVLGPNNYPTTGWGDGYFATSWIVDSPGVWKMLASSIRFWAHAGVGWFNVGYYRSIDSGRHWTQPIANPVMTGENILAPYVLKNNGKYYAWASETQDPSATLPTDIWRWQSNDFMTWTHNPNTPVFQRGQADEGYNESNGLVSNVCIVPDGSHTYMFYGAGTPANSGSGASKQIKAAISNLSLTQILQTTEGDGHYLTPLQSYSTAYIDSALASKQVTVGNIGDTSKYRYKSDTLSSNPNATASQYDLSLKQNTIYNIGDTSKYKYKNDSTNVITGYATQYDFSLAAKDTGVVHRYGTDTIFGAKTISNDLNINSSYRLKFSGTPMVNWRSGYSTVFLGNSGNTTETGINNMAFGVGALQALTSANYNTAIGMNALYSTQSAGLNTAVGYTALYNTIGVNNSGFGYQSGYYNTSGTGNAYLGMASGKYGTTASNNTAVGYAAGSNYTTGGSNTSIGYNAGSNDTTGTYNIAIGYGAGLGNYSGSGNTFIGSNMNAISGTGSNYILLGSGVSGTVRALFDGVNNYWNFAYPIKPKLSYSSNPTMTSGDYLVLPDKEYTDSLIRVIADSASNTAFVNSAFDTTARSLTMTRNSGGTFSVIIPRGTGSGASGIAVLSSTRNADTVTVSGDNGTKTTFSVNNSDSLTRVDSVRLVTSGLIHISPATFSISAYGKLNTAVVTLNLASQSAYTLLGRGSGSGVPSWVSSIDSNWVPNAHSQAYWTTLFQVVGFHDTAFAKTIFPTFTTGTAGYYPIFTSGSNIANGILSGTSYKVGLNTTSYNSMFNILSWNIGDSNGIFLTTTAFTPAVRMGQVDTTTAHRNEFYISNNYSFTKKTLDYGTLYGEAIGMNNNSGAINFYNMTSNTYPSSYNYQFAPTQATFNPFTVFNGGIQSTLLSGYGSHPAYGSSTTAFVDVNLLDSGLATKQNYTSNIVTGTGTTNWLSKWNSSSTQTYTNIYDSTGYYAYGGLTSPKAQIHLYSAIGKTNGLKIQAGGYSVMTRFGINDTTGLTTDISQNYSPTTHLRDTAYYYANVITMDANNGGFKFYTFNKDTLLGNEKFYLGPVESKMNIKTFNINDSVTNNYGSLNLFGTTQYVMHPAYTGASGNVVPDKTYTDSSIAANVLHLTAGTNITFSGAGTNVSPLNISASLTNVTANGNEGDLQIKRAGFLNGTDTITLSKYQNNALNLKGAGIAIIDPTGVHTRRLLDAGGRLSPMTTYWSSGSTFTIGTDTTTNFVANGLNTNLTISVSGTAVDEQRLYVRIKDNGVSRTITWPSNFRSGLFAIPTITTAGKTMRLVFVYDVIPGVGNYWDCAGYNDNF